MFPNYAGGACRTTSVFATVGKLLGRISRPSRQSRTIGTKLEARHSKARKDFRRRHFVGKAGTVRGKAHKRDAAPSSVQPAIEQIRPTLRVSGAHHSSQEAAECWEER